MIIILGVLGAVAVSRWPGWTLDLDGAAHQVTADLRYVQHRALMRAETYEVTFDGSGYEITAPGGERFADGFERRDLEDGISVSSTLNPLSFTYPFGAVVDETDVTVTVSGGGTCTVEVHGATGFVEGPSC